MNTLVLQGAHVATVDGSGTEYADGHVVVTDGLDHRGGRRRGAARSARRPLCRRDGLPDHPRVRQHPPPPVPVDHPRAGRGRHPVRLADHAVPGVGADRRRSGERRGHRCPGLAGRDRLHHDHRPPLRASRATAATCCTAEIDAAAQGGVAVPPDPRVDGPGPEQGRPAAGQRGGGHRRRSWRPPRRPIDTYHDPSFDSMLRIGVAPCSPFSVTGDLLQADRGAGPPQGRADAHPPVRDAWTRRSSAGSTSAARRSSTWSRSAGWGRTSGWPTRCTCPTQSIAALAATGTSVAHCPTSNARLGAGIGRSRDLRDAGVAVGLGVDGAASNEACSLLEEVRHALLFARARGWPAGADRAGRAGHGDHGRRAGARPGRRDRLAGGRQARRPGGVAAGHVGAHRHRRSGGRPGARRAAAAGAAAGRTATRSSSGTG